MNTEKTQVNVQTDVKVPIAGYIALIFAIIFFSGVLGSLKGWISAFDFNVINGKFGMIAAAKPVTFLGVGGVGAKAGFLFALSLFPSVMLALGIVEVVEHLGGLKAAQKLLTPILKPIIGVPGIAGLALVSSLQSTDAGAGMTRALREENAITEKEKTVFCAFQFSAGAPITNYLSSGAALFSFITVPIILPLGIIFIMKIVGANVMRLYLNHVIKEEI